MKKISHLKLALFLIAAVALTAPAQNDNRQRVIPGATPTPAATPAVSPTPVIQSGQTLFDLQAKIRGAMARPDLRRGSVGVKVVALDTGKIVFEENAEKYFMPASNMKSFTVAAAMEKLSPNFRFITSVYANSSPDASGTIRGDLTVYGRGDVSFSTAFYDKDYYKGLDNLADRIARAGVKRIEGNLVGDESYFTGSPIPTGWEWDDLQWYWGAEVSALPLNDNALDLTVKPGSSGAPCVVSLLPFNPVVRVVNTCVTTAGGKRDLAVKKNLDGNVLEISGTMPAGDRGFYEPVTVSRPAELFVALLKQRLEQKGVVVTGIPRVVGTKEKNGFAASQTAPVQIAQMESPPFSIIAAKTMKPSQNMYTETILWALGEQLGSKTNARATSAERGIAVVRGFLNEVGVAPDGLIQYDGSGLSRHNLVTPAALVTLYTYMAKQSRYSAAWLDSLTIGGVDGTLGSRFKGARTKGNVRGKTGTIDQVSALSGYVTTAAGERLVFSIIVNGVNDNNARVDTIDDIVGYLANFNGMVN
ncbi:MAG TPA: D-alanyl-D-alanine carboxypeptidase/D-alanyl-D-alanine-endopeptidase [Pyrinomonadaceae bacterium]|jgi:D-alanyl-D-alanine carboxypeptidase/D-alanyl-D-alanine-endopeptidase (penicillin-binding protein 4)